MLRGKADTQYFAPLGWKGLRHPARPGLKFSNLGVQPESEDGRQWGDSFASYCWCRQASFFWLILCCRAQVG